MIDPLFSMFAFGRVTKANDDGDALLLQITQGVRGKGFKECILDKLIQIGHFGHVSVPPLESGVLLLHMAGDRSRSLVVGSHHVASRPKGLKPGDSGLYDVRGIKILLTEDGLDIDCAGKPAKIHNFSRLDIDGDVHCTGDVISRSEGTPVSLNGLRDAYHAHKHTGVTAGGASSGLTDHDA